MGKKHFFSGIGLLMIAMTTLAVIGLVNGLGSALRFDLTENKLYTLSSGTEKVVENLESPVTLKLFFSYDVSRNLPEIRSYARRVQEILTEISLINEKQVVLEVINPESFSEEEDQAAEYGLRPIPTATGEELFFGVAMVAESGDTEVIPLLRPDRESHLEYEIVQALYRLGQSTTPVLGVISSVDVQGGFDVMSSRPTKPWIFYSQLEGLFDIQLLESAEGIPSGVDVLMLIHPKDLSTESLYQIDQFVLGGGRLIAFLDPSADLSGHGMAVDNTADPGLARLMSAWGVSMPNKVLLDDLNAVSVGGGQGRQASRHLGVYGLGRQFLNDSDIVTASLNTVNLATSGVFVAHTVNKDDEAAADNPSNLDILSLLKSSERTQLIDVDQVRLNPDPIELSRNFVSENKVYDLAVRVSGVAITAFPGGDLAQAALETKDKEVEDKSNGQGAETSAGGALSGEHLESGEIQVILVGDSDILADQMWVQVQSFLGQNIAQPFADNGTFILNALENLAGSVDLISIRSRAVHTRPFDKVLTLRQEAGEIFRNQEKLLNKRLTETETQLAQLQQPPENGVLSLTQEQQEAILSFQKERIKVRKALRDIQHQLNSDIDRLGVWLKLINILLIPLLIIIGGVSYLLFRRKSV